MAEMNLQIRVAARPVGYPVESDFSIEESPIPEPGEGELLLKTQYLSVDPYMRGRLNDRKSYAPGVEIGAVMIGRTVSEVVTSNDSEFVAGDIVWSNNGWQAYAVSQAKGIRKINSELGPVSTALGILGMPGMTAYFGLLEVATPKEGETVVVSAAAGAVGSLVGQIAKIKGCRNRSQLRINFSDAFCLRNRVSLPSIIRPDNISCHKFRIVRCYHLTHCPPNHNRTYLYTRRIGLPIIQTPSHVGINGKILRLQKQFPFTGFWNRRFFNGEI
jgi:hypothetical protein